MKPKKPLTDEELDVLMKPAISYLQRKRVEKRWEGKTEEERKAHGRWLTDRRLKKRGQLPSE